MIVKLVVLSNAVSFFGKDLGMSHPLQTSSSQQLTFLSKG